MTTHVDGLRYGPVGEPAIHLCIDMQVMSSEGTKWASSAVRSALPAISEVCSWAATRTVFTRFLTPRSLEGLPRQWRRFYEESPSILADNLKSGELEIVPELRRLIPPAAVVERYMFSAFASRDLEQHLGKASADTLILTGVETDVCVLATALSAIDLGYRLIIVRDAVSSSKQSGHDAVMNAVLPRFDQQVEIATAEDLLRSWNIAKA